MDKVHRYMTKEYKALFHNSTLALSIIMLAIISADSVLAFMAPGWLIRLIPTTGVLAAVAAAVLLYESIKHFADERNWIVLVKWGTSFVCVLISLLPVMLFVYLNMDWYLFATYGRMVLNVYFSFENMVLPVALMLLTCVVYLTLTIQLYKRSYMTYLCINKKEYIYGT